MRDLALSIVSHGHGPLLAELLRELDAEDSLAGTKVVVTLNRREESFDTSGYTRLVIEAIRNPAPRGFGANHNTAFARCATRWFAVLNPDLRLVCGEPFSALLATAGSVHAIGAIAPIIVDANGRREDSVRGNLTPWSLVLRHLLGKRQPLPAAAPARIGQPFYWLAGMCLVFDRDAYSRIGGFDERYFLYGEDYDICARLYSAGHAIAVDAKCSIAHDARRGSHRQVQHMLWHLSSLLRIWCSAAFWRVTLDPNSRPDGVATRR